MFTGNTTDNVIRILTTFSNLEELEVRSKMINKNIETILTKLTRLTKLNINPNNSSYEVLSLPHSNLLELTV